MLFVFKVESRRRVYFSGRVRMLPLIKRGEFFSRLSCFHFMSDEDESSDEKFFHYQHCVESEDRRVSENCV